MRTSSTLTAAPPACYRHLKNSSPVTVLGWSSDLGGSNWSGCIPTGLPTRISARSACASHRCLSRCLSACLSLSALRGKTPLNTIPIFAFLTFAFAFYLAQCRNIDEVDLKRGHLHGLPIVMPALRCLLQNCLSFPIEELK